MRLVKVGPRRWRVDGAIVEDWSPPPPYNVFDIPHLFAGVPDDFGRRAVERVTPGCEWVLAGEGATRRMYDGACCLISPPAVPGEATICEARFDAPYSDGIFGVAMPHGARIAVLNEARGRAHCWVPANKRLRDAHAPVANSLTPGTYELCGPRWGRGNPENLREDAWFRHDGLPDFPVERSFAVIRDFLEPRNMEGLVFWHPDGRLAKVRKAEFGFVRAYVY